MAETTLKGAYRANSSIYGAYQTNRSVWQANKDIWWLNKDVWRESLIKNMGYRFLSDRKKLIPPASIKEFFYAKYDKIVPI